MGDEASANMDIVEFLSAILPHRAKTGLFAFVLLISPPLASAADPFDLAWDMQADHVSMSVSCVPQSVRMPPE
jgi:hypothetical protein